MDSASEQSTKESGQGLIDAYLYLRSSSSHDGPSRQEILRAFEAAVEGILSASEPGRALSDSVLKQVYKISDANSSASLRELRRTPRVATFESHHHVEVVLLPSCAAPRPIRLAVFDMDSTLIEQETIDELARTVGKTEAISAITARAMRGELDFAESLRSRVAMLRGVRADVWQTLRSRLTIAKGARALCEFLAKKGVTMAVFSGGFQPMAEWLKDELRLNVAAANHLVSAPASEEFPFPHLTGELVEGQPIVTAERKRTLMLDLATQLNLPLSETLCVGDGANDLPMLNAVGDAGGIAIACHAKPIVQAEAPNRLNNGTFEDLIWLFGEPCKP